MKKLYSIVFHTAECYMEAMKLDSIHTYDDADAAEIELFWNNKRKRDDAVRVLRREGIVVDTFELVIEDKEPQSSCKNDALTSMQIQNELKQIEGCLLNVNTFANNSVEFRLQKLEERVDELLEKVDELLERFDEHLYGSKEL